MTTVSDLRPANFARLTDLSPASFNNFFADTLPGLLGIEVVDVAPERVVARTPITRALLAPHGMLHGGALVAIADTICGVATVVNLRDDATGFLTIELKSNFLGAANEGVVRCLATPVHVGRNTQVWDALVTEEQSERQLATFRCTQMVLRG
jgi:uncharacterized protein (TIGR00369 family)